MDVIDLPFNRHVGLKACPPNGDFLVELPEGVQFGNHLGTVHASALLAVSEATSAAFLIRQLGPADGFVPVVRRLEAKFCKPARGRVCGRCSCLPDVIGRWSARLKTRGRLSAVVPVEVVDSDGNVVLTASVEWFITRAGATDCSPPPN